MPRGSENTDPQDRKVILVASDDELVDCIVRAVTKASLGSTVGYGAGAVATASPLGGVAAAVISAGTLVATRIGKRGESTDSLLKRLEEILRLGVPIALYRQSEAMKLFKFGVGHVPKDGTMYVQHPILPNYYIPPEDFARTLAKEKEAAFRQLASALGAKELRLVSVDVHTKKGLFGAKASIPEVAAQVGMKAEVDENGRFVKRVYSRFGRPHGPPSVPEDLLPWVEMDPDLRTIARDRVEGHLLENHVTLEFKERMGASGEVAATVGGRGFSAGGSYEALHHSVWHFETEYWPLSAD